MANKKAKTKTTQNALVNKKTTTRVVSSTTSKTSNSAKSATKNNYLNRFVKYMLLPSTIRMMILELLGTFAIAIAYLTTQGHPMYMMFVIGSVYLGLANGTEGLFNPALSFAAWINRSIFGMKAALQIVAQVLGGMLGLVVMQTFAKAVVATDATLQETSLLTLTPLTAGKEWFVFGAELIGALILGLMLARAFKTKQTNLEKALTMGGATFIALVLASTAANYVGGMAILNPALLATLKGFPSENWSWITTNYVFAPMIGAVIGYFIGSYATRQETTRIRTI